MFGDFEVASLSIFLRISLRACVRGAAAPLSSPLPFTISSLVLSAKHCGAKLSARHAHARRQLPYAGRDWDQNTRIYIL